MRKLSKQEKGYFIVIGMLIIAIILNYSYISKKVNEAVDNLSIEKTK